MNLFLSPLVFFKHSQTTVRKGLGLAVALLAAFLVSGCAEAGQMDTQPRFDPLSETTLFADGRSARPFVPNTVPYVSDGSANSPINTGLGEDGKPIQGFPETVTQALVLQGQTRYNIYCVVCHGSSGKGDGKVVPYQFPKPPNLLSSDIATSPNSDLYNAITNGYQKMFPYGYRVKSPDRWAIIAYIRALELKNGPIKPQDLTTADLDQIGKHP